MEVADVLTEGDVAGGRLGASLAVSNDGTRAAAGRPGDGSSPIVGAVLTYTYDDVSEGWLLDPGAPVEDQGAQFGDSFGSSVAIANGIMAVGAPGRLLSPFVSAGSVSIFEWNAGTSTWDWVSRITQPGGPQLEARFGAALDLQHEPGLGWTLIVGAPDALSSGLPSGSAFLFESTEPGMAGGTWTNVSSFQQPGGPTWDVGDAVAVSGRYAIIGEPKQDSFEGAAYIVERDLTGSWSSAPTFTLSGLGPGAQTGSAVDIDGTTAVVGVPGIRICTQPIIGGCAPGAETDGAVVVLDRQLVEEVEIWEQTAELVADVPALDITFGAAVALRDERLIVGAPALSSPSASAFVARFDRTPNGIWFAASETSPVGNTAGFGTAVGIDAPPTGDRTPSPLVGWANADPGMMTSAGAVLDASGLIDPLDDCDGDGVDDACQIAADAAFFDCDSNGIFDACEIGDDSSLDCNMDGILDSCQDDDLLFTDCDGDGLFDACEIADGLESDSNDNGIPDSCELLTAEIVFVLDTSSSQAGDTADDVCMLIADILAELATRGILARPEVLYIADSGGVPCDIDDLPLFSDCLTIGDSVFSRFGVAVPGPSNLWPDLLSDSCESWAAAAAIVAANYPWETNLRMVVPIGDECAWDGDGCTTEDRNAARAALETMRCTDVMAMPIQFDINGVYGADVEEQMSILAEGDPTPPPGLDPIAGSGGLAFTFMDSDVVDQFADAVESRLAIHDNDGDLLLDVAELGDGDTGTGLQDCNRNLIDDSFEIRPDIGMDFAGTQIPTLPAECEVPCEFGDVNLDFNVTFDDLLGVLNAWGPCADPPCAGDVDGDGIVGFGDVLVVLANYGWCAEPSSCSGNVGERAIAPQSILDCIARHGSDPIKLQRCIEAMIIAETP